jgi:3-hydroxyisobutyryl-CoA hydrolase
VENKKNIEDLIVKHSSLPKNKKSDYVQHLDVIERCFGGDSVEIIFKKLKDENSTFTLKLLKEMKKFSPTSLKVTFKFMKLTESLDIDQTLRLQYNVSTKFFTISNDFIEGVRAKIVDKDFKPKWNPKTLEETSDQYIDKFFDFWDQDFFQGHLSFHSKL